MATIQVLKTYYSDVMRVDFGAIPASDLTLLNDLSARVDAGVLTLSAASEAVGKLAINTTTVATLSYQFFTGATPYAGGLDYLVSPQGPNPNNLNAAYYQGFNLENRFINFAVNLGQLGEAQAQFNASYGSLTLRDAVAKAYAEIFGTTAASAKLDDLLNAQVPDGLGGTETRAQYFAFYGRDGADGTGTKAAAIGWLLAQAAKEDVGTYAKANDAFLADLSPDGVARFHSDLTGTYGPAVANPAGATIAFNADQSVTPTATDPALRSTDLADTITGRAGLDAGQSVQAGAGGDTITVPGAVSGYMDAGAGDDTIILATLNGPVAILGVPVNGAISAGAGNDTITITQDVKAGATIDGGAGDDSVTLMNLATGAILKNVEHLYVSGPVTGPGPGGPTGPGQTAAMVGGVTIDLTGINSLLDVWNSAPGVSSLMLTNVQAGVVVGEKNNSGGLWVDYAAGVTDIDVHLDNTGDGLSDGWVVNSNGVLLRNATGIARIHVDSDSAVRDIFFRDGATMVVDGLGKLTAQSISIGISVSGFPPFTGATVPLQRFDASAAAEVHIGSFAPGGMDNTIILSGGDDTFGAYLYGQVRTSFTLGAGSDTLSITKAAPPIQQGQVAAFANLRVTGQAVDTYATVSDFQKGVDHIDLGTLIPSLTLGLTAFVGAATTLEEALVNVSSHLAAGATGVFEYAGDSYIYRQDSTVGVNTGDGLIKLVGVTGLTTGTGGAAVDIHYG